MGTGVVPSSPRFSPSIFIAHRVQQSRCSSSFHRVLLSHALAFSASQFVHKKKSPRIYTRMHSGGFELTKLTYTRLEDNLIRHLGDRLYLVPCTWNAAHLPPIPRATGHLCAHPAKGMLTLCTAITAVGSIIAVDRQQQQQQQQQRHCRCYCFCT